MQGTGKKELSKKILCSILAAGVLSVGGVQCVWANPVDSEGNELKIERQEVEGDGSGRYAYIVADGKEYSTDGDITINAQAESNDSRIYAIDLLGKNLTLNAKSISIDLSATGDTQVRTIRNSSGGDLVINADLNVKSEGEDVVYSIESWKGHNQFNQNVKVESVSSKQAGGIISNGGNNTFSGESVEVDVIAGASNAYGATGESKGITTFNNKSTIINASTTAVKELDDITGPKPDGYGQWANGIYSSGNGKVIFNSDYVEINAATDPYDSLASTSTGVRGEGYGNIQFADDVESVISAKSNNGTSIGIWTSYYCNADFSGTSMTVNSESNNDAWGVTSRWSTTTDFNADKTDINAKSINGTAIGVYTNNHTQSIDGGQLYASSGIDFNGDTSIKAVSDNGDAYGIYAYAAKATADQTNDKGSIINFANSSKITAEAAGTAVGVYASGKGYVYEADTGNSYTFEDGTVEVNLTGPSEIIANGGTESIALFADTNAVIDIKDAKVIEGDVIAQGGGKIFIDGTGIFDGNKYKYNIDSDSSVELLGGTIVSENITDTFTGNGKLVLKDSGVLSTTADQIFTNGGSTVTATGTVDGILGSTANKVTFESGTVSLNDAEYTFNFVKSAVDAMGKHEYEGDKTSNTGIVMTGDLLGGIEDNKISVDDAASVGDDIALDKVTVEADNNLLVGAVVDDNTEVESITIHDSVTNGFNAGSLNLAEGSTGMVITNDKNVTLGGSAGGNIITVTNNENAAINVVVGTNDLVNGATSTTGSFTIGNALATSETKYTLNGSVTVNADSNLTTNGQTTITEGVTLNGGNLDAASGALNANVTVKENTTNTITGTVNAGKLTAGSGTDTLDDSANKTVINIGNNDKAANVVVTEADLNGATVFLDPAWKGNDVISDASNMAVANVENGIDGHYVVGQNSVLSFGVDNTAKAQEVFAKTGLTWGEDDITAALYIADTVDLTSGSVVVNGSLTDAPATSASNGTFTAEKGSVTMIDGSKFNDTAAAITGVTTATIDDGAKLYIDNAKKNETYKVISGTGVATEADDRWSTGNIDFDNTLLVVDTENTKVDGNTFVVGAKYQKVDDAYGKGAVVIADIIDKTLADKNEGDAAFDFFNAAASENGSEAGAVAAFNSAANMGEMGGVNHAAYSVSNAMTDAVADHLSIATHGDQDKDIWAHYVHNKENIKGISLGGINADYDLQYNGIVVGSDLYKNGKATAGIALSYVEGDVNSYNIAANTKNEAEYYGASVYGRIDNGNSAVLGDITYMHGSSDITQHNSGHKLTADADTDVFSIGVKAEQKVEAGIGQFVPYAGLRYMHIGTGNYTNSIGMNYDVDEQNLWLLPVGVTYSCEAQKGDWTIRPVVEAGYVWAMGDRDTNQTVSLNGAADGFGFDTADSGSFISRFAVEAEKANVIYSLGYEYQKGDTVKANKWMANMTFTF